MTCLAQIKRAQGMVLVVTLSLVADIVGCLSWEPVGPEEAVDIRLEFTSFRFIDWGAPQEVGISADYAYVLSSGRLTTVNVSDRRYPTIEGEWLTSGAQDLAVGDGYVYLSGLLEDDLTVIDVQDPGNPEHVGDFSVQGWIRDITVLGDRIYLAVFKILPSGLYSKICVVDISEPAQPKLLCESSLTPGPAREICVDELNAYLLMEAPLVHVFDIRDPTALPCIASYWPRTDLPCDISASQGRLCIACFDGVEIATVPSAGNGGPVFGCVVELPEYTDCLFSQGNYVYADGSSRTYALNIQDPANAFVVAECEVLGPCTAICAEGDWLYRVRGDELSCYLDILRILRDP